MATQGRKRSKNESTTNVFDEDEIEIKQKGKWLRCEF
jgi:hypothetical protein